MSATERDPAGSITGSHALLLVTQDFAPSAGGIQRVCVELARALSQRRIAVHVLAPNQPGAHAFDRREPYAITRYGDRRPRAFGVGVALLGALRESACPVLFAQWTGALAALLPRCLLELQRFGLIAHGKELMLTESGLRGSRVYAGALHRLLQKAQVTFAVSEFTAKLALARGARPERIRRLHLGVDSACFAPVAASMPPKISSGLGPHVLTIARLVPRKGIDTTIEAIERLRSTMPEARYLIVGEGPDRPRLLQLVARLGLQSHVQLLGEVSDDRLRSLLQAADVFVLASREEPSRADVEGFGLVLLEAQACGTPVVATHSGGMSDAVAEGESGLLVPADDAISLANALQALLGDTPRRVRMRTAARAFAMKHSWQRTAEEIEAALFL
jgi:phosphatidylinositol alpha-1,6-mannosyltransferase